MEYRGVEGLEVTTEHDPVLALNQPGMKLCINVLTAGRPNYLYICLDSIFRNTVFAAGSPNVPDVFIYVDMMKNGDSYADEILKVASEFPIQGVFINREHKGTVANYWHSFSQAFDSGYDFCVLIEEDWLITTQALQWFYDVSKIASHYSLYRWEDRMDTDPEQYAKHCFDGDGYTTFHNGLFLSWCVAFPKEVYKFIYEKIKVGTWGYMYNPNVPMNKIRRISYIDWDATLIAILKQNKLLSMCPPKSYLAHFGCQTSNFMGYGSGVNRHEEMFKGEKKQWLDNVIELFKTTTVEEKPPLHFYPLSFKYS